MMKRFLSQVSAGVFLTAIAVPGMAWAQAVPSTAEPSRVERQIAPLPEGPVTVEGEAEVTDRGYADAPAGSEKVKFVLKDVTVDGATAYETAHLRSAYKDMLNEEITLADVYALARRLTVKYRNDGYILTQVVVPEQTIEGGKIRLRVVEGFVDKVTIQGDTSGKYKLIEQYADKIRAEKPLNAKKLERYMLLMRDLAGVSARAVLSPSSTRGASDVTIIIEQKHYDVFAQVDNRGSQYLGPAQATGGVRLNNVFGMYEGLDFQVASAPEEWPHREMDYFTIRWNQPVNSEGTQASIGYSLTSTAPGYTLAPFAVKGLARNINFEVSHPLVRSRSQNVIAHLKFDYVNSERKDNLGPPFNEDHLRVLRGGGSYQFADRFVGFNTIEVELSKGLNILNASDKFDARLTRASGDPAFVKGTFNASRLQRVTNVIDVFVAATGQKSSNLLLASEEFGVGGASFGSAYDNSEITGEDGIAGRLELRANDPVDTFLQKLQVYGFVDAGMVWDPDNATLRDRKRALTSSGFGLRSVLNDNFSGTFELAVPMTRKVAAENNKHARLFGSVAAKF
ncbi:MAG: ShlB/FhaC/HecB family hemolysin secretion/activation protein [Alphaproteobacteria bacterium]|nr:ShlB/FhaC/HecB family hemolysin secretion/activation protein [Alphaproteobacteria bacterium]